MSRPDIDVDEEVPRYPPYEKGLPVYNVQRLMGRQRELLLRIRQIFPFTDDEYDRLILPIIERYASFVHLLPASEHHHHKGAGGLFRHGLEVALWTGQASDARVFLPEGTPLQRKRVEIRWKVALFIGGLLHDIGKPISDLEIVNADGSQTWRPFTQTIYEWANQHGIERYFLRWRDKRRYANHRTVGAQVISQLLPKHVVDWLYEGGPDMHVALTNYLAGIENFEHVLVDMVTKFDAASVEADLQASGHGKVRDPGYGVPVESFLMDAMRELVGSGEWKVNEPGARVWLISDGLSEGTYIVWKRGVEDILQLLQHRGISGIPRNPDTLADVLFERNLAQSRSLGKAVHRYWPIAPDALANNGQPVRLMMLRLVSPQQLFNEPPPYVSGIIDPPQHQHASKAGSAAAAQPGGPAGAGQGGGASAATPSPNATPTPTLAPPPTPAPAAGAGTPASTAGPAAGQSCSACNGGPVEPLADGSGLVCRSCGVVHPAAAQLTTPAAVSVVKPGSGPGSGASPVKVVSPPPGGAGPGPQSPSAKASPAPATGKREGAPKPRAAEKAAGARSPQGGGDWWPSTGSDGTSATPAEAAAAPPPEESQPTNHPDAGRANLTVAAAAAASAPTAPAITRADIEGRDDIGRVLIAMAEAIASGQSMWGESLAQLDGHLVIPYPDGLTPYLRFGLSEGEPDAQPAAIGHRLADVGWLELETPDALKKVREIGGVRGLVLRRDIAALLIAIAGDGSRPSTHGSPAKTGPRATPRPATTAEQADSPKAATSRPVATPPPAPTRPAQSAPPSPQPPRPAAPRPPEAPAKPAGPAKAPSVETEAPIERDAIDVADLLIAWVWSEPCPDKVTDMGEVRILSRALVHQGAKQKGVRSAGVQRALAERAGVRVDGDDFYITEGAKRG